VSTVGCRRVERSAKSQRRLALNRQLTWKKNPVDLGASEKYLRSLGLGILNVALDLVDGRSVDERTVGRSLGGSVTDLEGLDGGSELLGEGIVDLLVDEDAVGADAGLSGETAGVKGSVSAL
jgi:hypothetical protein